MTTLNLKLTSSESSILSNGINNYSEPSTSSLPTPTPSTSSSTPSSSQSSAEIIKNSDSRNSLKITEVNRNELNKNYSNNNEIVLLNNLFIKKKRYRVFLHSNLLTWEMENSKKEKSKLPVCDIISIKSENSSINENDQTATTTPSQSTAISTESILNHKITKDNLKLNSFTIYYAKRKENLKDKNVWRFHKITFSSQESRIISLWILNLNELIKKQSYRPKKLLLFVNPFGGKKTSMKIFEKYGKPLFEIGNIDVNVVVSQRANQIKDFIQTQYLDCYDGIVCVGGDGTFSEVFNGILLRTMRDLGLNTQNPPFIPKPKIPIGIIPGGSTDTVSYCLHGTTDIQTAVIHIVLGQTDGLDLSSVSNCTGLLRFYASVIAYGYLGDVAYDSEKFRWMGTKRYEYSGFKKFLLNRGYESEISILVDEKCNPHDEQQCHENCTQCYNAKQKSKLKIENTRSEKNIATITTNDHNELICDNKKLNNDNLNNDNLKWKTIKGKFFMINGANVSCACARSPKGFSPYCHLGDGNNDLVLIRHTSFINNIRLVIKLARGNSSIAELPFVEIHRTRRFCLKTINPQKTGSEASNITTNLSSSTQPLRLINNNNNRNSYSSNWNCDGEILQETDITVQTYCQLINVFRRGLKPTEIKRTLTLDGTTSSSLSSTESSSFLKKCSNKCFCCF